MSSTTSPITEDAIIAVPVLRSIPNQPIIPPVQMIGMTLGMNEITVSRSRTEEHADRDDDQQTARARSSSPGTRRADSSPRPPGRMRPWRRNLVCIAEAQATLLEDRVRERRGDRGADCVHANVEARAP